MEEGRLSFNEEEPGDSKQMGVRDNQETSGSAETGWI